MKDVRQVMDDRKVCVVVPTYNNAGTIVDVLRRTAAFTANIIVVIDGCTDDTRERLRELADIPMEVVDYAENKGKGHALLEGFKHAISRGYEYAITLDSDGQHFPEDIPNFIEALELHPEALIVGARNLNEKNMPGGNTFANRFSNFWFTVQTGIRLPDTQTGYRLYPLRLLSGMWLITSRYEAELELLVLSAWSGERIVPVPVRVYYPPEGERVSHFRPAKDFLRISLLNTLLCVAALFYGWPRALWRRFRKKSVAAALLLFVAVAVTLALRVDYEEDIARFLPVSPEQQAYQEAVEQLTSQNRVVVVFKGEHDAVKQAMDRFEHHFAEVDTAQAVDDLQVTVDETQMLDMLSFVTENAPYLLTEADYSRMDSLLDADGYVATQLNQNKQLLLLPTGGIATQTLGQDPLHLFTPLVERLQTMGRSNSFVVDDGYVFTRDGKHGLAFFSSPYGMSESARNAELAAMTDEAIARTIEDCPEVKASAVGGPLIAVGNAQQIKHDSMLAVAVAVTLILTLLIWHYRRLSYLMWIAASLAFGWLTAIACMALFLDSISVIVLGIGSVIIGIAANYPLHYLDHLMETGDCRQTRRDMTPPLLIGNITTVSAFLCLVWLDSVAMRDLGIFGSLMLVGTIVFVLVVLPLWAKPGTARREQEQAVAERPSHLRGVSSKWVLPVVVGVTLVLGYFSLDTSFDSDLRHINYMTDSQREDMELLSQLSEDVPTEMAALIPTAEVQRQRLQWWQDFCQRHKGLQAELQQEAARQGFATDAFSPFQQLMEDDLQPQPSSYFEPVGRFLGGQHLLNAKNVGAELVRILQDNFNYVSFVCGFVVFFFLWLSFRRIELAMLAFLPLAVSWLWILGLMQLLGVQFNIVNIILATFIFGQGDDYTIFITEGLVYEHTTGRQRLRSYRRSVMLSATLMFIGIGTLILAKHPALRSLAEVTIIGMGTVVVMAYYLPPLVFRWLVDRPLPLTLKRLCYSLFSLGFFLCCMYLFVLPYTWLYFHIGKVTEERKMKYHGVLQRLSSFVIHHVPGVKFQLENKGGETFEKPAVVVCNHQSHLDLMCLMMLTPRIVFLTNDWVWHNPFYGMVIHRAEFYPVSNGIENHVEQLRDLYQRGYSICVFPEGTRSEDCSIQRFHKGAFYLAGQLQADVLPIFLHGVGHVLPKKDFMLRQGQITVDVEPRISQGDPRFAEDLLERTKQMRHYYQEHYQQLCQRLETPEYWKPYRRLANYYKMEKLKD